MNNNRFLLGKTRITGYLTCETGLHIGASKENVEIGAIDAPVVRDPVTRQPYIPGSSLKGKLRSLLEKVMKKLPEREIGRYVHIHACEDAEKALNCEVCRLFGSTASGEGGDNFPSRVIVRDLYLTRESEQELSDIDTGLQYTEWKFENAIDRVTSAATPRQIERVPKGAKFELEIIYNVEEPDHIEIDLKNLKLAFDLLQLDALGGYGSRGYGKVSLEISKVEAMSIEYLRDRSKKDEYVECTSLEEGELTKIIRLFNREQEVQRTT